MKQIGTFLMLLCATALFSQSLDKSEIRLLFWGKDDPYTSANSIPGKYAKESAVVIFKNEVYEYRKFGTSVKYIHAVRKRIKLLDQAAVKEFSEFSFNERFRTNDYWGNQGTNTLAIKIVKPDGSQTEIDVDKEAKDVSDGSDKKQKDKKLAIAGLEPGDIIDFYLYSFNPFISHFAYGFEPRETTLGDTYPIMDYKLSFRTENDFFLNFNSYNGAPELREIPTDKSNERRYELVATDIAKNDFPKWFYPLVELPCYKFQVYFARSGKFESMAEAFLPENEKIVKKNVSKQDVLDYYSRKFRPYGDMAFIERFVKGKQFSSPEEQVREVYYFTRHYYFTQYIDALMLREAKIFTSQKLYGNAIFMNTETEFINHFMAFLKDFKYDYDIIVGTARYNGPIEDLLIQSDLKVLLRVNTSPNPVYLEYFTPHTSADQFSYELENSEAYVLDVAKRKKIAEVTMVRLPGSTASDNLSKSKVQVAFNQSMDGLSVDRESGYYGHMKDAEQQDKLVFCDFVDEDYRKYGTESALDMVRRNRDKFEKYTREYEAVVQKIKDKQKETFEKSAGDELDATIADYRYEIANTGRFGSKMPMVFKEQFTTDNSLIKKAGVHVMVEVGRLIGAQVQIDKDERERQNNVYFSFPRSFENEISFVIPSGYAVSGIDKLNKNITNSAGSFVSTAKVEGHSLVISVRKSYNNYYEPQANWPQIVEFLDAAYQFTQEKVLFKKI